MGTRMCANKKNSKGNDRSRHSKGPRRRNSAEHRRRMRTRSAIPTACRPPDSLEHREFAAKCRASRRMPTSPWMGSCVDEESGYLLPGGQRSVLYRRTYSVLSAPFNVMCCGYAWPHFGLQGGEGGVIQLWCRACWGIHIISMV